MVATTRRLTICIVVLFLAGAGLAWGPAAVSAESHVSCTVIPTDVEPGEEVTLDARDTEAEIVDFDIDGDGTYDRRKEPEFIINVQYEQPGRYEPVVRANENPDATASCGEVVVGEPPEAVLEVTPNPAKADEAVTLDASESSDPNGEIVEYRWDLNGDGEVNRFTEEPVIQQEYSAGSYTPSVTVVDNDEITDTDSQDLTVNENQPPTADFTVSPNPAVEGETVSFDASASSDPDGSIVEYQWDFDGDEQVDETTTTPTTETSYDTAGNYVPLVTVVDDSGDSDTASGDLTIEENQPPTADFTVSPNPAVEGETVSFDASGSSDPEGNIVEYQWDFDGDEQINETTTTPTTETSYDAAGNYVPIVTVVDGNGGTATTNRDLTIEENQPPTAEFSIDPRPGTVGEPVTFDASASSDPEGNISEYRWDFDGDNVIELNTTNPVAEHTYDQSGSAFPSLTVVDDRGQEGSASADFFVEQQLGVVCQAEPTSAGVDEVVTLNASGSNANFVEFDKEGDGTYNRTDETDFVVEVTYAEEGTYQPMARADGDPGTAVSCGEVTIETNDPPTAEFSIDPRPGTVGQPVTFDASASSDPEGNISEYRWDFDGDSVIELNTTNPVAEHTYDQSGSAFPSLTVVDGNGGTATTRRDFAVEENQPPTAEFSIDPRPGTVGEAVTFDASASSDPEGNISEYRWDFDGDSVIELNTTNPVAEHTYDQSGSAFPSLTVVDDGGLEGRDGADFFVEQQLGVVCQAEPTSAGVDEVVTLDASGSNATFVEFDKEGDGTYEQTDETDFVIEVTYAEEGTYQPMARADGDPETAVSCGEVTIEENQPPTAEFSIDPRPGTVGQPVTFDASASSDPDADIAEYRWDFDGDNNIETVTADPVTEFTYDQSGSFVPSLTVVDSRGQQGRDAADLFVEQPSSVVCQAEPTSVGVDEAVTLDASGSEAAFVEFDREGDGEYERTDETDFVVEVRYGEVGTVTPVARAGDDPAATAPCGEVTVGQSEAPTAGFAIDPRPGTVGEPVTFDASDSFDPDGEIVEYRWDFDGDGTAEETTAMPTTEYTYDQSGSFVPTLTVLDDDGLTGRTSADYLVEESASLVCQAEPRNVTVDEFVTLDATGSGVSPLEFDANGDGTYDNTREEDLTLDVVYSEPGTYEPTIRAPNQGGVTASCGEIVVQRAGLSAAFDVEPQPGSVGQTVSFDASNSTAPNEIAEYQWDFDGDGTVEETTTTPTTEFSYNESDTYDPQLIVVDETGQEANDSETLAIEAPGGDDEQLPLVPIGAGAGGILGGLGVLYYFFGGGGAAGGGAGGGGGGGKVPKPKPKPSLSSDVDPAYETGVFEIPSASGSLAVTVGFEPDLVFFSATNGARTDSATDRTAGWSRGIGWNNGEGITNYSLTVADDAQTTDQATCGADDESALQLLRHSSERPPGRVRIALTETSSNGFEVDVQVPGNDPFASGIRVHYQAIRTASETDVAVGTFTTPTEPGTQVVDLDVTADHVSLLGSAAVSEPGRLWTTDRGVSLSTGHAVAEDDRVDQAVWGASAWPRSGHDSAAVTTEDGLNLLYQDGDALAGRTRATVADIGSELRLRYDRVYNGPHKLGSTARHVVAYLGMAGGDAMRPAVGAVPMPRQGEKLQVDCGFEPAMVEVTVSGAPLGEEVPNWAAPQPFGYSEGTAISDDDGLRQYVLHHAFTPTPQASATAATTGEAGGEATADGGASTDGGQPTPNSAPGGNLAASETEDLATAGEVTSGSGRRTDPAVQSLESEGEEDPYRVRHPSDVRDDEIVGIAMICDTEGTVLGRDECRVTDMTQYGFDMTTERVAADDAPAPANRPTLVYRAWPAVDGREDYSQQSTDSAQTQGGGQQSPQGGQPAGARGRSQGTGGAGGTPGGSVDRADGDNMTGSNMDAGNQPVHDLQGQTTDADGTEGGTR